MSSADKPDSIDDMLEHLQSIDGGYAWESVGNTTGTPHLNLVLCGEYYGFYVTAGHARLKRVQLAAKNSMKAANASVYNIRRITDIERILGCDDHRINLHRAIPPARMKEQLWEWGKGDYRLNWLDKNIRRLDKDHKTVIVSRYMDKKSINQIMKDMHYARRTVFKLLAESVDRLIELTIEGDKRPVNYITPGWEN